MGLAGLCPPVLWSGAKNRHEWVCSGLSAATGVSWVVLQGYIFWVIFHNSEARAHNSCAALSIKAQLPPESGSSLQRGLYSCPDWQPAESVKGRANCSLASRLQWEPTASYDESISPLLPLNALKQQGILKWTVLNIYTLAWSVDSTPHETGGRGETVAFLLSQHLPDGPCCSLPSERLLILHCSMNVEESLGFVLSNAAIKLYWINKKIKPNPFKLKYHDCEYSCCEPF